MNANKRQLNQKMRGPDAASFPERRGGIRNEFKRASRSVVTAANPRPVCVKCESDAGEPGHRSDLIAVEISDSADPSGGRPPRESGLARGVVGVAGRDGPFFEHWLAVLGRKELKAEVRIG
jgi:hypothetical protein